VSLEISNLDLTILSLGVAIIGAVFGIAAWLSIRQPDDFELNVGSEPFGDVNQVNDTSVPARFFHIEVSNLNKRRVARNCYAYMLSLKEGDDGPELVTQTFELKWRGFPIHPNASVLPSSSRKFDAFWIWKTQPERLLVSAFVDSSQLVPNARGTKTYGATYLVIADNIQSKQRKFEIHLDNDLAKVTIRAL
jgi:hypothetical protein